MYDRKHFATPIYYSGVDNLDSIQEEIQSVISKLDFQNHDIWGETHYLSDKHFKNNFIKDYNLTNFKKEIEAHVKQYCFDIGVLEPPNFTIYSSWVSLFKKKSYGHPHHHGYADIAGVYYFETNEDDGNIYFQSPNPHLPVSYLYQKLGYNWEHKPQMGKIILFPGWLYHGISANKTDCERMSISFNIIFDKSHLYE